MTLRQAWQGMRLLHLVLLAMLATYGFIGVVVSQEPVKQQAKNVDPALFVPVLAAVSIAMLGVIWFLRRKMLPPRADEGGPLDLERAAAPHEVPPLNRLRATSILSWALCEAIGIYGLILTILFHDALYYVPFAALGAGAMIALRPTRTLFDAVIRGARPTG